MNFKYLWVPEKRKGCRYFVRYGATTKFNKGFNTKQEASQWIEALEGLDWRVWFRFRMKGDSYDVIVVNRRCEEMRP